MSLNKTLPPDVRAEMQCDPFYEKCCLANSSCRGRIEWHHNLIYAGSRVNLRSAILPVCEYHHSKEKNPLIGEKLDYIMLKRAGLKVFQTLFPKRDWERYFNYLKTKYART